MSTIQTKESVSTKGKAGVVEKNNIYTSFVTVHRRYFPTQREILELEKNSKPSGQGTINPDIFSQILNYQD